MTLRTPVHRAVASQLLSLVKLAPHRRSSIQHIPHPPSILAPNYTPAPSPVGEAIHFTWTKVLLSVLLQTLSSLRLSSYRRHSCFCCHATTQRDPRAQTA